MPSLLAEEARQAIAGKDFILRPLQRYARELGVSEDFVILAALKIAAEEYNKATGGGMIPLLD